MPEEKQGVSSGFTKDMMLLTESGYQTLQDLCDKMDLKLVSINFEIGRGAVWKTNSETIYKITLSTGIEIKCSETCRFMTVTGKDYLAKNLLNKKLMPMLDPLDYCHTQLSMVLRDKRAMKAIRKIAPTVVSLERIGKEDVYSFFEESFQWGFINGVTASNT